MPNDKPPKDPWCNPLEMPDGSKISGAPARERRIKKIDIGILPVESYREGNILIPLAQILPFEPDGK